MRARSALAGLLLGFAAVLAPALLIAQSTSPAPAPTPVPGTAPTATTAAPTSATGTATVGDIVEISRAVTGSASVYTPAAGATLVITDIVLTNPNPNAACGVEIRRAGASVTGPLCVPPRTTIQIGLMTGIEFAGGTAVELAAGADAGGPVNVHLRGFLMA